MTDATDPRRPAVPVAPRLREASGFTLVETLLALAIFAVLAGIVSMGVPVAWRAYTAAVDTSNAQILLSTATTLLRDELGRATSVKCEEGSDKVERYLAGEGYWAALDGSKPGIGKVFLGDPGSQAASAGSPADADLNPSVQLVGAAAMPGGLEVTFDDITYGAGEGVFTVDGLRVEKGGSVLAQVGADGAFKVRAILSEVGNG